MARRHELTPILADDVSSPPIEMSSHDTTISPIVDEFSTTPIVVRDERFQPTTKIPAWKINYKVPNSNAKTAYIALFANLILQNLKCCQIRKVEGQRGCRN